LYTSCVLGLHPFALFNEIITYKKKMYISKVPRRALCLANGGGLVCVGC
jgi:hypothetical protein